MLAASSRLGSQPQRRRWLPYRWRHRVQDTAVRRTLAPLVALAGFLTTGGGALCIHYWSGKPALLRHLGSAAWSRHDRLLLLYIVIMSCVAFVCLVLITMGVLDGVWMFSLARNVLMAAGLCLIILLFRQLPADPFLGFLLCGLLLAMAVSFTLFGPFGEHLGAHAIGDALLEVVAVLPFLSLAWLPLWATQHVRLAWRLARSLWREAPW